jgi:hypothetical protein
MHRKSKEETKNEGAKYEERKEASEKGRKSRDEEM